MKIDNSVKKFLKEETQEMKRAKYKIYVVFSLFIICLFTIVVIIKTIIIPIFNILCNE